MPKNLTMAVLATAALVCLAGPAAGEDDLEARLAECLEFRRETFTRLAGQAEKKGYVSLAGKCLLRAGADPAEMERLAALPEAEGLSARKRAPLDKKYDQARRKVAARLAAFALSAREEDPDAAREAARQARRLDPDHAGAREVLGQVSVPLFGWVPAADADRLRSIPRSERERMRTWKEAWTVESDHWRIRSNLPLSRIGKARDLLERFHERWTSDWEGWLPLEEAEKKHAVLIFAKKAEYEAVLAAEDPHALKGVPGQYSPNLSRSAFFDVETLRTGSNVTTSLEELMLHECTHQLFFEDVVGRNNRATADDAPNFWAHEGIAEFYGLLRTSGDRLVIDRKVVRKMARTLFLKERIAKVPRLSDLDGMGRRTFLSSDGTTYQLHYATAGFLCWFLEETRSAALRRLYVDLYTGKNEPGALSRIEADLVKLDREYRKFLRGL